MVAQEKSGDNERVIKANKIVPTVRLAYSYHYYGCHTLFSGPLEINGKVQGAGPKMVTGGER